MGVVTWHDRFVKLWRRSSQAQFFGLLDTKAESDIVSPGPPGGGEAVRVEGNRGFEPTMSVLSHGLAPESGAILKAGSKGPIPEAMGSGAVKAGAR